MLMPFVSQTSLIQVIGLSAMGPTRRHLRRYEIKAEIDKDPRIW